VLAPLARPRRRCPPNPLGFNALALERAGAGRAGGAQPNLSSASLQSGGILEAPLKHPRMRGTVVARTTAKVTSPALLWS